MLSLLGLFTVAGLLGQQATAKPLTKRSTPLRVSNTVDFHSHTYINQGLVAFGYVPAQAKDSYGETLGGFGSAIALQRGSFKKNADGSFSATLIAQPDRGYNVEQTVDWQGRQHTFDLKFTPYYSNTPLSFANGQQTLQLTYKSTMLYWDRLKQPTSGLDALGVRNSSTADPLVLPIPSASASKLSLDAEGLILNADGSFWVSDEYGPYIHLFDSTGTRVASIQPPQAVLPMFSGKLNFTSVPDPDSGRAPNQGFEGLTASPDGSTIYALLQTATEQDGGKDKSTSRYTRLFAWDTTTPGYPLVGEWVVPLPQSGKGNTYGQSEIHYLTKKKFLVLSRDGDGMGSDKSRSDYKGIDMIDIEDADDIHGKDYDTTKAVAPGGKLDKSIVPAEYQSFVSLVNATELARFGLHNDGSFDTSLINAKWESLAFAPCLDDSAPNDFFIMTVSDNDFITVNGTSLGKPYSSIYGKDVNSQVLVFRVTMPTVELDDVVQSLGL